MHINTNHYLILCLGMGLKGDLGVNMVAYQLMRYGWEVSINYGKFSAGLHEMQGYDIFARKGRVERKVEVKLRDGFNGSEPGTVTITDAEYRLLTHLVVVLLYETAHTIYIIPKSSLRRIRKMWGGSYRVYLGDIKNYEVKNAMDWQYRLENS